MFGLIASFLVSKTDFNNKYFEMEIEAIWNCQFIKIFTNDAW